MNIYENPHEAYKISQEKLDQLIEAKKRVAQVVKETPMIYSYFYSQELGASIYLKAENLQRTGAFKLRGAYNKISMLSESEREKGLIASSAGNHAQGVALAARELNAKATIVMPSNTPLIKVEATRQYGAEVILHGECYDDAFAEASRLCDEFGYSFIHPFDDEDIIIGQGTLGLEILEQLDHLDYVVVPIGGGGLISGIALAIKALKPEVRVIGVEPTGAQTLKKALEKGGVYELKQVNTIAEGVAVKKAGQLTYQYIRDLVDEIVTVDDVDIMEAFLLIAEKEKLVAENAGVLSVAALKKLDVKGKTVVSLLSGGNIDVVTISELISRGLVVRGRVFCFAVELPDTPGQLKLIATILSDLGANIIKLEHNQFKTIDRFKRVHLEVTCETNGKKHVSQIKKQLAKYGYTVEVIY